MSTSGVKKLLFEENERVLCYHGPLIYEAKVILVKNIWCFDHD